MDDKSKNEDDFLVTFTDILLILKRAKKKILLGAACVALATSFYTLTRPLKYEVKSSFREKGTKNSGVGDFSLSAMFSRSKGKGSEALSLMQSRKLLERLVESLDLQASLTKKEIRFNLLGRLKDNLISQWAYIKKKKTPVHPDNNTPIRAKDIYYPGEVPLSMEVTFLSENTFAVKGMDGSTLKEGKLNHPFQTDNFSFILIRAKNQELKSQTYTLTLSPLPYIAEQLMGNFIAESDLDDPEMLILEYSHRDRHLAADTLNTLMYLLEDYLREEQQRVSEEQIAYLQKRHETMGNELNTMMTEYAETLSSELSSVGFANTEKAMEFLALSLQEYKQKLLRTDLEIKRLQKARDEGVAYYDQYASNGGPSVINKLLSQIRELKQQRDAIELALRNLGSYDHQSLQEAFSQQMNELDNIQAYAKEAHRILKSLDNNSLEGITATKVFQNPRYMVQSWYKKLMENHPGTEEVHHDKENFTTYLSNLIHFLQVHEKTIQERLAHQQGPQGEFEGINLNTANDLYINYSKELSDVEAKSLQHQFILDQMQDENFEISSLSSVLHDSVSKHMIDRASGLILQIKDQENRSEKETVRLKDELAHQKRFLTLHVQQTIKLMQLRQELLRTKIQSLQSATLGLIQQQISILEKHLADYISTRLNNLHQEEEIIAQQQQELQQEVTHLPKKWASEKLIDQQVRMNQKMVEEITRLVESKNIANNLEIIQSAPIDLAYPPILPKSPRLLLYALFGAFLGAFGMMCLVLVKSIMNGITATEENLRLANQHVAGWLSPTFSDTLLDTDLETLRRLTAFLEKKGTNGSLVLIQGNGPDYSPHLGKLLSKQGLKVIVLPLSFGSATNSAGLLQYLEGETSEPHIQFGKDFDTIASGGICRYSNELVSSRRFLKLFETLRQEYDWVIGVNHTSPASAEAESVIQLFECATVTVVDETLQQLQPCITLAKTKVISFVFTD